MTTIIIVDYSLEIVIAIINYDHHNLHWMMFIPLFEAIFLDENKHSNCKTSIVLSLKCELYIGLVSSLNKKVKYACYYNALLKLKQC